MPDTLERQVYYIDDLKQITGRSAITLRRWWEKGKFPKPTKLHSSVSNQDGFNSIKNFIYKEGMSLETIINVLGIYLRDIALSQLNFCINDIPD